MYAFNGMMMAFAKVESSSKQQTAKTLSCD
jgi:hypothetical protein